MWGVDNEIRTLIKQFVNNINGNGPDPSEATEKFRKLAQDIREMIYKEEKILFPEALRRLSQAEWGLIRQQEEEIGYFDVTPMDTWHPAEEKETQNMQENKEKSQNFEVEGLISLSTGALTRAQINLMLTHLPVDVTFVDENDHVRYFSQGKERIFDRSPAIIGREVTKCHPPQSVHKVEIILDDFRSGKRDVAEFWIQAGDNLINIRYFALHSSDGTYKGCIEVSQDVTHIRGLEGEKRLLDDAPDNTH